MRDSSNNRAMPDMGSRTAAMRDSPRGRKSTRGCGWFSLFFWPAFRRIFFLDNMPEVWQRRRDRGYLAPSVRAKRPNGDLARSTVPQVVIDTQLEQFIGWTLECNIALAAALKSLRNSYKLLQAGKPGEDAERILAQVEELLNRVDERNT
jgi:hypothetical protein